MTSNCIQDPKGYKDKVFTTGPTAWPGVRHIANRDFSAVIEAALRAPGYEQDGPADEILVGFGHNAVLNVAGTVVEAVKAGAIRHFFLIGGCDGARPGRNRLRRRASRKKLLHRVRASSARRLPHYDSRLREIPFQ